MKIGEPHSLCVQPVEMGCFQSRVAVRRKVAETLVIRQNDDDVRSLGTLLSSERSASGRRQKFPSVHGDAILSLDSIYYFGF